MIVEKIKSWIPVAGKLMSSRKPTIRKALTPLMMFQMSPVGQSQNRTLTTKSLTKNIEIISSATRECKTSTANPLQITWDSDHGERPLSILLCWLMSQKAHILKYARFYLDQGFDVMTVRITPWQLLWPVSGSQIVAKDVLNFMSTNMELYPTTMLHGFSVGAYLWGEALKIMSDDMKTYQPVINNIAGQIWDSVVDFEGIPTGFPNAVFPNNPVLRTSLEKYIRLHMANLHNIATKHYLESSRQFHNSLVKSPALFLGSYDDSIGCIKNIQRVIEKWESRGGEVYLKAWESSPHVSHLHHHPKEYKLEMKAFLEKLGLVPYPEKFAHHQKSVATSSG